MPNYRFEYTNENNNNCLLHCSFIHPMDAWMSALRNCGWDNRTSLKMMTDNGRDTILNWFQVSSYLPLMCTKANYESNYNHHIKKSFWDKYK